MLLTVGSAMAATGPNVIVIMADDIGAECLESYGSTIYTTPNLDRMAEEGVRFENAYSTPLCTPTRVMIMSGLYPNRTGYLALMGKGEGCRMPAEIRTFGHDLRDAGYKTAIAGKWQLGKHEIDQNTLVIFTGDNGTHGSITSKLPGLDVKGGKGSMSEAGTRVPFIAWWPGRIAPAVRDEFICLVDVLPTISSLAGIKLDREVDGMNLSHNLLGTKGEDRERVLIAYKGGQYFVREKRFRLNVSAKGKQTETLYDIPVSSDAERYSEAVCASPEHESTRQRLRGVLDAFMSIGREYGENPEPDQKRKPKEKKTKKGPK